MTVDVEMAHRWVGCPVADVPTPALLLDRPALKRNIAWLAASPGGTRLRPHVKAHKCAEIAGLQRDAGARGLTCATVGEADFFAQRGFDDLLIANQIVGPKINKVAEMAAAGTNVCVVVDDTANAQALSHAAKNRGATVGVLLDVDTGMRRCGVRNAEEAVRLAQTVSALPGLELRGVSGYEGHCVLETDRATRTIKAGQAMDYLLGIVAQLRQAGFACSVVSAGGTGTWDLTAADARVTEIQAGSYVFLDATRGAYLPEFEYALTLLCTVVSRQGDTLVTDGGRKTIGAEFQLPRPQNAPALTPRAVAEEHLLFDISAAGENGAALAVGDTLEIIPGYAPTTANLHPFYFVVENGQVVDIWEIGARGAGFAPSGGRP